MNLERIIADNPDLTGWFKYEAPGVKGLELEIAYIDPDQLAGLERQHGGLEKRDEYVSAFIRRALRGWRGMTFKNLRSIVAVSPLCRGGVPPPEGVCPDDGHEFVFTLNGAIKLVQKSYGLWGFIFSRATSIRYFQSDEELKNSETGPGGT